MYAVVKDDTGAFELKKWNLTFLRVLVLKISILCHPAFVQARVGIFKATELKSALTFQK
jgi:hypothetical protein